MGNPPLVLLYTAAALNGAFLSIAMPTRARDDAEPRPGPSSCPQAAALNQVMWNGAGLIGPALGGIVIATAGLSWAYGIDVVSYVAALTAAFMLRPQRPEPVEGIDEDVGFAAVMNGLRYVKGKRILQSTYTVDIVAMVFGMPRVLFPVLAVQQFHHGAGGARLALRRARLRGARRRAQLGLGGPGPSPRARDPDLGRGVGRGDRRVRAGGGQPRPRARLPRDRGWRRCHLRGVPQHSATDSSYPTVCAVDSAR